MNGLEIREEIFDEVAVEATPEELEVVKPINKLGKREKALVKEFNRIEHDNQKRFRSGREPSIKGLQRQHHIKVLLGSIKTLGAIEFH